MLPLIDGGFAIVWLRIINSSRTEVHGQRFASDASPIGTQFKVSTHSASRVWLTRAATLTNGGFVVVWHSQTAGSAGAYAQLYDHNVTKMAGQFQINSNTSVSGPSLCVTGLVGGGFVVAWRGGIATGGVYCRLFDTNGVAVAPEAVVYRFTNGHQDPYVAIDGLQDGGFIVSWSASTAQNVAHDVYARRFSSNGVATGTEFKINSYSNGQQYNSCVSSMPDGGYVVSWLSEFQDGSAYGCFGRRYDVNDTPHGPEFQFNSYTTDDQTSPYTTALADGGFLAVWNSEWQTFQQHSLFGQRFDANSNSIGGEFRVNGTTTGQHHGTNWPGVRIAGTLTDGRVVVSWIGGIHVPGVGNVHVLCRLFDVP